jgi:hypothetical protein
MGITGVWRRADPGISVSKPDAVCGGKSETKPRFFLMVALLALVLILAIFGGLGFAAHVLWIVLVIAVLLWLIGFFVGGVADGGRRRWYGRW